MPYADKEQARAYLKAWKQANREKVRAWGRARRRRVEASPEGKAHVRATEKRYRARHPEKVVAKNTRSNKKYAVSIRNSNLKKLYGITHADYEVMFAAQQGRCAICPATVPGGGYKHFAVDHNHRTGKVRALLCHACNTGLGRFKDDPALLREAVAYLVKHGGG